jgi:hypothetical protein
VTRQNINTHRKAIEDKKKEIAELQSNLSDLEDDCLLFLGRKGAACAFVFHYYKVCPGLSGSEGFNKPKGGSSSSSASFLCAKFSNISCNRRCRVS